MCVLLIYYHFHERRVAVLPDDFGLSLRLLVRVWAQVDLGVRVGLLLGAVGQREVLGMADHDVERVAAVLERQLQLALDPARRLTPDRRLLVCKG